MFALNNTHYNDINRYEKLSENFSKNFTKKFVKVRTFFGVEYEYFTKNRGIYAPLVKYEIW